VFHYLPLHLAPFAIKRGVSVDCPVTKKTSNRLIRLPFHTAMMQKEQKDVIQTLRKKLQNFHSKKTK
jgi:dTDP-4-amino-4,6-dideoxygalactose transaminase